MRAGGMMIAGVPGILIGRRTIRVHDDVRRDRQLDALRRDAAGAGRTEPQTADAQYQFLLNGSVHAMDRRRRRSTTPARIRASPRRTPPAARPKTTGRSSTTSSA
jgi:hypothetical protein